MTDRLARAASTAPAGYSRLSRSGPEPQAQVGCLFVICGILLIVGIGLLAAFIVDPSGKGDMWVMPVVGGVFALIGAALLIAGVRGARGLKVPPTEVYIEHGAVFGPGSNTRLRVHQPGPVTVESLTVKAVCERVHRRRVKADSDSTVEDQDLLWEQELLVVRNETVPSGATLEREATISLPENAVPSGPASPDGLIRWRLEVRAETGVLSAIYHPFDIVVRATAGEAPGAPLSDTGTGQSPPLESARTDDLGALPSRGDVEEAGASLRFGCLAMAVGFLGGGGLFIWMFFSGIAFEGQGNPYMALVGGTLFAVVGLFALVYWFALQRPGR